VIASPTESESRGATDFASSHQPGRGFPNLGIFGLSQPLDSGPISFKPVETVMVDDLMLPGNSMRTDLIVFGAQCDR
jgi:hypothetical protein